MSEQIFTGTAKQTATDTARELARLMHQGQEYKGQSFFQGHLQPIARTVESMMRDDPEADLYVAAAWLHDIVEDTPVSQLMLRSMEQIPEAVEEAVYHLTHPVGMTYTRYIELLDDAPGKAGRIARAVKLADLQWNLANCIYDPEYQSLATKYAGAIQVLLPQLLEDGDLRELELGADAVVLPGEDFSAAFNDLRNG